MPAYPPFAPGQSFDTQLDPGQEAFFRQWVQHNNVPFNPDAGASDYDMRGYYKGLMNGNPMARPQQFNANDGRSHFTDYYKTPSHQTFSNESQWAAGNAPTWVNDHQLAGQNGRVVFDERPFSFAGLLGN